MFKTKNKKESRNKMKKYEVKFNSQEIVVNDNSQSMFKSIDYMNKNYITKSKKNAFKETGVGRKIITLKKNDILVKNGENRDGNSYKRKKVDLLNNKEFKFYLTSDLADIINDSDCPYQLEWTVNVLDRQIGHFLECNHHPYNSCGHKDFIKGIFNIDLQYTGDFNDWLENIPKARCSG